MNKRDRFKHQAHKIQIAFRNGRLEIPGADSWQSYWHEPYYLLLTVPWWLFLSMTILTYLLVNALFAVGFWLGGNCVENATPGSFSDLFFFSVQTLTSIGYGAMYPLTTYANILVTIEAFIGIIGTALITSLAFTRFAQPTAKVMFSQIMTISEHNGVPTLMLRAGNQRHNQILEAKMRVYLMRDEVSQEGEYMRRFYPLKLSRDRTPRFTLSWTVMHPIDECSPLWQATAESLAKTRTMIMVDLSGIDETVSHTLHAPHSYSAADIRWSHRFADIIRQTSEGHQYVDYTYFHHAIPVEH
ncbi:MAG: ion channel [Cyanobacteria bacterium J06623_7]